MLTIAITAVTIVSIPANHKEISGLTQLVVKRREEQVIGCWGMEMVRDLTAKGQHENERFW